MKRCLGKYGKGLRDELHVSSRSRSGVQPRNRILRRDRAGLGYDFAIEVYSAIQLAVTLSKAWLVIEGDIRRTLVRRFPYGVMYSDEYEELYIIAVMHLHRHPDYWKRRK